MNQIDILIILIIITLFSLSIFKLYKNARLTKVGLGCAGCRIADTCQKPKNINRINKSEI